MSDAVHARPPGSAIITPEDFAANNQRNASNGSFSTELYGSQYFVSWPLHSSTGVLATAVNSLSDSYLRYDTDCLYITQRIPMKVSDLQKVMGLSMATIRRFLERVCPSYLSVDHDENLHINTTIFRLGTLPKKDRLGAFQKVYIEAIRCLYRATPISNHKQLGYTFRCFPISTSSTMCCARIHTKRTFFSGAFDCARVLRVNRPQLLYCGRLREAYSRICFTVNGQQELFCAFVSAENRFHNARIFVTSMRSTAAADPEQVQVLGYFCKSQYEPILQF